MHQPQADEPAAAATAGRLEDRPQQNQTRDEGSSDQEPAQGVVLGEIVKTAREKIRVSLNSFKGYRYLDLRVFAIYPDGDRPTKQGITVKPSSIPGLRALLQLAEELARREGLIP
jgi:ATP phosphoribosyltransferase regulatory subunit HisZ